MGGCFRRKAPAESPAHAAAEVLGCFETVGVPTKEVRRQVKNSQVFGSPAKVGTR